MSEMEREPADDKTADEQKNADADGMECVGQHQSTAVAISEEEEVKDECLDLTGYQLHSLEGIELSPNLQELDLTENRLNDLDPRIWQLTSLRKLCLRQNLLSDASLEPLSSCQTLSGLQELILRDNKLRKLPCVNIFKDLLVFDISYNEISSLKGMSEVSSSLKELYVSKNEVTKMEELEHLENLQILELGSNGIRVMECLHNMKVLQELWLGRNRIRSVDLFGISSLVKISLQSNRLTSMLGFQHCIKLEELYLSHNGISKMEGLSSLINLKILDVGNNKITTISDIECLTRLEDLWLNENQICSLEGIEATVAGSRETLTTIYLQNNPCAKDPLYVSILRSAFPNLTQIDSTYY